MKRFKKEVIGFIAKDCYQVYHLKGLFGQKDVHVRVEERWSNVQDSDQKITELLQIFKKTPEMKYLLHRSMCISRIYTEGKVYIFDKYGEMNEIHPSKAPTTNDLFCRLKTITV